MKLFCFTEASERLKLREVVCELRDLYAWYLLGVYLGLPKATLDQIHADYGEGVCICPCVSVYVCVCVCMLNLCT